MKKLNLLFVTILLAFAFGSCTMVKQHYSSGFYIHKNGKNVAHEKTTQQLSAENQTIVPDVAPPRIAITNDEIQTGTSVPTVTPTTAEVPKKNSPLKQTIQQVKKTASAIRANAASKSKSNVASHWIKKSTSKISPHAEGKSQIVALLLCIFLGPLGIHRFYLGYTGMGLLYLFTVGLFGIGWLIDIILLIIPNGLTPKGQDSY